MSHSCQIKVQVRTQFLPDQSAAEQNRWVFAYTITIENQGTQAARLLNRRWVITDANGKTETVSGEGVVGEQPLIAPGETYEYTSGAIIDTPVGAMEGAYGMVADDGHRFEAAIAPFTLAVDGMLN